MAALEHINGQTKFDVQHPLCDPDQLPAVRNPCAHDCTPKTGARCIFRPVTKVVAIRLEPPTTPTPFNPTL